MRKSTRERRVVTVEIHETVWSYSQEESITLSYFIVQMLCLIGTHRDHQKPKSLVNSHSGMFVQRVLEGSIFEKFKNLKGDTDSAVFTDRDLPFFPYRSR
jgi:hypothetical protein